MEILSKFSSYTKILRKFFIEKLYKIDDKKKQNLLVKKILQKCCESFAEISKKFCRNFEKFLWKL